MYPYGRLPNSWPFSQTRALLMAPSNITPTDWPLAFSGRVKALRYHPVPKIGKAPVWGFCLESNGPSMAQSCGRRSSVQAESWKPGCSAPAASPLKKRQPSSKFRRRWPVRAMAVGAAMLRGRTAMAARAHRAAADSRRRVRSCIVVLLLIGERLTLYGRTSTGVLHAFMGRTHWSARDAHVPLPEGRPRPRTSAPRRSPGLGHFDGEDVGRAEHVGTEHHPLPVGREADVGFQAVVVLRHVHQPLRM